MADDEMGPREAFVATVFVVAVICASVAGAVVLVASGYTGPFLGGVGAWLIGAATMVYWVPVLEEMFG